MIDPALLFAPVPVSTPVLVLCVLVVFGAYLVFGVSGFGASLMTIPVLSQVLPLGLLLSLAVVLDLSAAALLAMRGGAPVPRARDGDAGSGVATVARAEVWRLGAGAVLGAGVGVTLLVGLPVAAAMFALGVFLLAYGLWSWRSRIPDTPIAARWGPAFGFGGGLLGALFGIGGPPYVIYLTRRIVERDRLRATIGTVVLASLLIRFVAFAIAGVLLQPGLASMLALLLPACAAAVLVGQRIGDRLSRRHLLRAIALLLAASGAALVVRAWPQLGG